MEAENPEEEPAESLQEEPAAEEVPPAPTPEEKRYSGVKSLFAYVENFGVALAVLIVIFLFVCRYVKVDGDSMMPTLHGNERETHVDQLIISDLFYTPKTGDIVVLSIEADEQPLIKRVIATEGQSVRINFRTWEVYVDEKKLDEPYINYIPGMHMYEADMRAQYGIDEEGVCRFTVEKGKVFVMGDNRNNSKDSRSLGVGQQDVDHILGKVILRLFPFSEFGTV